MGEVPVLSAECAGWARTAGYEVRVDSEATVLWPVGGGRSWYRMRRRGDMGRVELSETDSDGMTEILLFAVGMDVTERFLIGALGDDIRDHIDLPFLELPWRRAGDLAIGFAVSGVARGYRTLSRAGVGPIAAAAGDEPGFVATGPVVEVHAAHARGVETVVSCGGRCSAVGGWPVPAVRCYRQ